MLQQLSSVYFLVDQPNLVMIWENRPVGQKQTLFILFSDLWSINRYLLFAVFCRVKHCQCVFSLVYLVCKFVVWQSPEQSTTVTRAVRVISVPKAARSQRYAAPHLFCLCPPYFARTV